MGITESYITILDNSLSKKIRILDDVIVLNNKEKDIIGAEKFDEEAFDELVNKKSGLIDTLNELDDGFELIYGKVKEELSGNKEAHAEAIKSLQQKISEIMEKSNHIKAEEVRNKAAFEKRFATLRKEVKEVKKTRQIASNYYKTMNKLTTEPVFMDKKK